MDILVRAGVNNAVSATVLALLVLALSRALRTRPAVRHCLWLLVLLKLITPPLFELPIRSMGSVKEAANPATIDISADLFDLAPSVAIAEHGGRGLSTADDRRSTLAWLRELPSADIFSPIGWIWLAGSVVSLIVSAWRINRFRAVLKAAEPAEYETQDQVDDMAADLGIARPPGLWWIAGRLSPMLWAFGSSPRLIIPIELWKSLDDRQRVTLLVHELAHLRRGDHHVRVLELVVTTLFWWHPVLWWSRHALHDAEEQCCDAWVVWCCPEAARSYAETLLETLDFLDPRGHAHPFMASGFGRVQNLRTRLTMIMTGNTPPRLGLTGAFGSLAVAILLLPINASWGQKADEPAEVKVIVKSDDLKAVSADSAKAFAITIDSDKDDDKAQIVTDSPEVSHDVSIAIANTTADDGKSKVNVNLNAYGSAYVVQADSMNDAIKKLKDQIDLLQKKDPKSATDKLTAEALEQAVKSLSEGAKKVESAARKATKNKALSEDQKLMIIRRVQNGDKISTEDAIGLHQNEATREMIAKLAKLRAELSEKQKDLEVTRKKMRDLQQSIASTRVRSAGSKPIEPIKVSPKIQAIPKVQFRIETDNKADVKPGDKAKENTGDKEKRIADLEATLRKLLEEVSQLKKK
jgi:beta-lactamase regulating signal transducer with metallopeptidase domain